MSPAYSASQPERAPSPCLQVTMLDRFSITLGQRQVGDSSGHSKKVWLLLAYLIYQKGRAAPYQELANLLWDQETGSANPRNAMKTTFFRTRTCLDQLYEGAGHQLILRKDQGYAWSQQLPLSLDLDRFEALCAQKGPDALSCWMQALDLFGQGFIPKLREFSWAAAMSKRELGLYMQTLGRVLPILEERGDWEQSAALCAAAVQLDLLNEGLYRRRMNALLNLGDSRAAAQVFEDMNQLFLEKTGGMPGEEAQALYRRAVSHVNDRTIPPAAILEQLREEGDAGAFFCDYDVFRALYRLHARDMVRTGERASLAVLSVTGIDGGELARRSLDLVMENLRRLAPPLLRQGDAMSKCSVSQYVLLLPRASFENSQAVCRRIQKAFLRQYPHTPARLRATVCPLKPETYRPD